MELSAHDVVAVTCKDGYNTPALPIPESDSLIVTTTENPRQFNMELHSSNVVQVAGKSKQALFSFVVPYLNFVIITT